MTVNRNRGRRLLYVLIPLCFVLVAALALNDMRLRDLSAQSNPTATIASSTGVIPTSPATPVGIITEVWGTVTPGTPAITPLPTRTP